MDHCSGCQYCTGIITGYFFGVIGIAISTLMVYVFAFLLTSHYAFKFIRCNFYYASY